MHGATDAEPLSSHPLVAPLVTLGLLALGCSSGHHEAEQQRSAVSSSSSLDDGGPATCPPIAGSLVLYAIPPPAPLDWSTPNHLLETAAASSAAGEALVTAGGAALSHEIGHVNLELDCGDTGFPLTGQTGGGSDIVSGADGAGILLRDFPGSMNEMTDSIGDNADTVADIASRQASGNRVTW